MEPLARLPWRVTLINQTLNVSKTFEFHRLLGFDVKVMDQQNETLKIVNLLMGFGLCIYVVCNELARENTFSGAE